MTKTTTTMRTDARVASTTATGDGFPTTRGKDHEDSPHSLHHLLADTLNRVVLVRPQQHLRHRILELAVLERNASGH